MDLNIPWATVTIIIMTRTVPHAIWLENHMKKSPFPPSHSVSKNIKQIISSLLTSSLKIQIYVLLQRKYYDVWPKFCFFQSKSEKFTLTYFKKKIYSWTSHKRPPKMQRFIGCLQESNHMESLSRRGPYISTFWKRIIIIACNFWVT